MSVGLSHCVVVLRLCDIGSSNNGTKWKYPTLYWVLVEFFLHGHGNQVTVLIVNICVLFGDQVNFKFPH